MCCPSVVTSPLEWWLSEWSWTLEVLLSPVWTRERMSASLNPNINLACKPSRSIIFTSSDFTKFLQNDAKWKILLSGKTLTKWLTDDSPFVVESYSPCCHCNSCTTAPLVKTLSQKEKISYMPECETDLEWAQNMAIINTPQINSELKHTLTSLLINKSFSTKKNQNSWLLGCLPVYNIFRLIIVVTVLTCEWQPLFFSIHVSDMTLRKQVKPSKLVINCDSYRITS